MAQTRWVCLLCWSTAEWQVFVTIQRAGYDARYPHLTDTARRGRWQQPVVKPQYPGYVFARWEPGQSLEPIRQTIGVRDVLRVGADVVIIPDAVMSDFERKWRAVHDEAFPHRHHVERPEVGTWVAVPATYPFAGVPACIEAIDKNGQITASLGTLTVRFPVSALPIGVRGSPRPSAIPNLSSVATSYAVA